MHIFRIIWIYILLSFVILGRTTIVVAHRLSTIRNCDLIIAFDGGRVIEFGTHDDLVSKDGVYSNLLKTQLSNNSGVDSDQKQHAQQKLSKNISKFYLIFLK